MDLLGSTPSLRNAVKFNRRLAAERIRGTLSDIEQTAMPSEPGFLFQDRKIGRFAPKPQFERDEIQQFITDNINYFRAQPDPSKTYEDLNKQVALRELYDSFYLVIRKFKYSFTFEDLFGMSFQQWSSERLRDGGKNNIQQILKLSLLIILLESYGKGEEDYQLTQQIKYNISKIVRNLTDDVKWFFDLLSKFDCKLSELFFNIQAIEEIFSSVKQINKRNSLEILDFRLVELIKANVLES